MYWAYVLKSKTSGKLYYGQTNDLEKRVYSHNHGLSRYTRKRGPWELVYSKNFATRAEAMRFEKFLKSGKGRQLIKDILADSG